MTFVGPCTCGKSISGVCQGGFGCHNHLPSFTTSDSVSIEAAARNEAIEFGNWLSYNKKWFCGEYDEDGKAIFRYTEDMYEKFLAQKRGDK